MSFVITWPWRWHRGRQETREGSTACKKTKKMKACVCLSLLFSTPLHKSSFTLPNPLLHSLSSSHFPVIGRLVASTEPQTCLIQVDPLRETGKSTSVTRDRGRGKWSAVSLFESHRADRHSHANHLWLSLIPALIQKQHELLFSQPSQQTAAL